MSNRRDHTGPVGAGQTPAVPGTDTPARRKTYRRGASGQQPRRGNDTYMLDDGSHRYDGKCHKHCPYLV